MLVKGGTGGNLCQCQYKATYTIYETSRDPLINFYGRPLFLSGSGQHSFWRVLISPIAPKGWRRFCVEHIQLWAVAVCELPSQTKVAIMPTCQHPACNYWKFWLVLRYWPFLEGYFDNEDYWVYTMCHQKGPTPVRESNSLSQGLRKHILKTIA